MIIVTIVRMSENRIFIMRKLSFQVEVQESLLSSAIMKELHEQGEG